MFNFKLLYCVFLLWTIGADSYSFDDYQAQTGVILDLLHNKDSNKHLINTVVDCMGKTFNTNGKSNDFLRCVNDLMHTDDLTNTDDIRYIIGNYAARASKLMIKCYYKKNDIFYCLRAFGDCLPLLFRGLYGHDVHNRSCKRLTRLPKYDNEGEYSPDDEEDSYDEYGDYDKEYDDDYDEYDDGYDEYDYDEDEEFDTEDDLYDGETDSEDDRMKSKTRRRRDSASSKSSETSSSSVELISSQESNISNKSRESIKSNASKASNRSVKSTSQEANATISIKSVDSNQPVHTMEPNSPTESHTISEHKASSDSGDSFDVIPESEDGSGSDVQFSYDIVKQLLTK